MKTLLIFFLTFPLSVMLPSESEARNEIPPDSTAQTQTSSGQEILDAINISVNCTEGNIVKAEKKFAKDKTYWEVELLTISGSEIKLRIETENNRIFEVIAEEGPFDYELNAGDQLIRFSEARDLAEKTAGGNVLKWKLVESKAGMQYHFWLFTKGGSAQFKVDAVTGERIMKKQTKKKK